MDAVGIGLTRYGRYPRDLPTAVQVRVCVCLYVFVLCVCVCVCVCACVRAIQRLPLSVCVYA